MPRQGGDDGRVRHSIDVLRMRLIERRSLLALLLALVGAMLGVAQDVKVLCHWHEKRDRQHRSWKEGGLLGT